MWHIAMPGAGAILLVNGGHGSLHEAYAQGIATRSVDRLGKAKGMSRISRNQVSRLCEKIDGKMTACLNRPLEGDWPCPWINATSLTAHRGERIVSVAGIIVIGVSTDRQIEVPGLPTGISEVDRSGPNSCASSQGVVCAA
ncbi:hypothetical protein DSD19_09645 [Rhodovulum sp. BSW8]|nr:transposase [Rhodovulum sp. BSW8]RBO53208.1 hypothetical protein DSD19_09645 [Rhodovulum sp. BSW8]